MLGVFTTPGTCPRGAAPSRDCGFRVDKKFAELLGGRIAVESTEGKGSTFILIVPCEPAESAPVKRAIKASPAV
jgi:light-regulated signal transduction histidine kinase (bacteriophytochrome)